MFSLEGVSQRKPNYNQKVTWLVNTESESGEKNE